MFPVMDSFWVFLSKFIVFVFGSIFGYFFRFSNNRCLEQNDSGAFLDSNFDDFKENQSIDHVDEGNRERENSSLVATSTSKYEFLYRKGISGFIEEPKIQSFTVHEFYMGSNDYADCNGEILDSADGDIEKIEFEVEDIIEAKLENSVEGFTVEKVMENYADQRKIEKNLEKEPQQLEETNGAFEDGTEDSVLSFSFGNGFEKQIKEEEYVETKFPVEEKAEDSVEDFIVEKFQEIGTENIFEEKAEESVENILEKHVTDIEGNDHVEEKLWNFFDSPVIDIYLEKWKQEKGEYNEDGEMFDLRPETHKLIGGQKVENMEHEIHEAAIINDSDDEFIEFEPRFGKLCVMGETESGEDETESMVSLEKNEEPNLQEDPSLDHEEEEDDTESMVSLEKTEELNLQEDSFSDHEEEEEEDDLEFGSEHDDLIERLKMELKFARTGGLPTILEESDQSPKMMEELGPLQIDEKYDYKDHIAEIQKVYKSYSDKMRKLDILNSQTMHAISLIQLKDPDRLSTSRKSSAPAMKSLLSHKVLSFKQRKSEADPVMKLIRDLHKDFETVYVGQVCLSWEILHWQFGKVKNLLECDSQGMHQYNQVAGEFQHFQVLVQRFLEDEPFQPRPRVENYVKNRCALKHLLQVPVIKDDCSKYKENAVSSEMLTDIIEESMHVFWEFLRADKDESNAISKTPQQAQVAPHDPIDLELLLDVRTDLQKKEKKVKEIQRSTNCIIKKFKRQHQGGNLLDYAMFIAQVELKLVSRVLNMLKITTDQLVWCHEKLQRINFSNSSRKIEIEPSFTLFPC
ncbi:hypothetical protein REPUB_Repub01dG0014600 [Reevesia pubescens]